MANRERELLAHIGLNAAEIQYLHQICVNCYKSLNPRQKVQLGPRIAKEVALLDGLRTKLGIFEDPQIKSVLSLKK